MIMFFKDKKVLVTGGTGFVGAHIVEELLRAGAQVRVPVHQDALEAALEQMSNFRVPSRLKVWV